MTVCYVVTVDDRMLCGMGEGQSMMHNYGQRVDDNNLVSLHPHPPELWLGK